MGHSEFDPGVKGRRPWNAGRKLGAKRALKPQQVWAVRFWPDREGRLRDRALFDLATDCKLRGGDVVKIKIGDLVVGGRAIIVQQKTGRPVQFELLDPARGSILAWLERRAERLTLVARSSSRLITANLRVQGSARLHCDAITSVQAQPLHAQGGNCRRG